MRIIVNDADGKSYKKEIGEELSGKSLGDKIDGSLIGLDGYELQISGGSDKQGFAMRKDIEGIRRKRVLLSKGPGFKPTREGERRRKSLRGKVIAEDISVINLKVIKKGKKELEKLFKVPEEETKE